MTALLALLGTALGKYIAMAAGALVVVAGAYLKGRSDKGKSATLDQKAKEADAYAKHIKDVEDAAYARDHVSGGVQDDPRNRDRQG
jgi:hypothetical protein